jgi:hypothetical protein
VSRRATIFAEMITKSSIQVLQEVAAARRILIMCGLAEMNGYCFSSGLKKLDISYKAHPDLQRLILPVLRLIRGAIFRPKLATNLSSRVSLEIGPLGDLMDAYHTHNATDRRDKVYALLNMSTDDTDAAGLLPDYEISWEKFIWRLIKFRLCKDVSVKTWGDRGIAVIKSKGRILGKLSLVQNDIQSVDVVFCNIPGQPVNMGEWSAHWTLQVSANSIRDGDLVCILQGASTPTIIRACKDYFAIVIIATTPPTQIRTEIGCIEWPKLLLLEQFFIRDFLLAWDWEDTREKLHDPGEFKTLIQISNSVPGHSETELQDRLDEAIRIWNVALIFGDLKEHEKAGEILKEVIEHCEMAFGERYETAFGEQDSYTLRSQYGQTPLLWAAGNGYNAMVTLLLANNDIDPDLKNSQYRQTPLSCAAQGGHEAVVKLLLETGKVDVDSKDSQYRQTPLLRAAQGGHAAVVKLLLETGKVDVNSKSTVISDGRHFRSRQREGTRPWSSCCWRRGRSTSTQKIVKMDRRHC